MSERPLISARDLRLLLFHYPLRSVAAVMPPDWFLTLSRLLIPAYLATARKPEMLARANIARALGLNPDQKEVRVLARRFLANNAMCRMTDLVLQRIENQGKLTCSELSGLQHLERARAEGKGVMVVSGHFQGNRAAKRYLASMNYPMLSVRDLRPPDTQAGRFGRKFLAPKPNGLLHRVIKDEVFIQDPDCSLAILRRLRAGGIVNVHVDALHPGARREFSFLGTRRAFATGFLKIAYHARSPIVPMQCLTGDRGPRIVIHEALIPEGKQDVQHFIGSSLAGLVALLERQILRSPEQWQLWVVMDRPRDA